MPHGSPVNQLDCYSADYFAARERFIDASRERGFRCQSLEIVAPSPTSKPLTIDVAVAGAEVPRIALVLSSGVHGVEGPFGSAVQLAYLDALPANWQPPADSAVILLHALNPFGYAWQRRFNEENVDLNRNFLLPNDPYSGAPPLSARFRNVMSPANIHRGFGFWNTRMALLAMRHGPGSFWRTLPVGQYDYPEWLFFGGRARSQTVAQLDRLLPTLLGTAETVVHLDFHTGLGRWAECELLLSESEPADNAAWWRQHFQEAKVKEATSSANSYAIRGGFGKWLQARFPDCAYRYAVAEFGTYSPRRVIQALAEELRCHFGAQTLPPDHRSRKRLAEVFVPRDPQWRIKSLETGLSIVRRAQKALWL